MLIFYSRGYKLPKWLIPVDMLKQLLQNISEKLMQPHPDGSQSAAYLYKKIYKYIWPYRYRALVAMLITIPIGTLDSAVALSLKPYIDGMQAKDYAQHLTYVPLVIVGFTCLQGLLNYLSIYLNGWLGLRIMDNLRLALFEKLQTLDVQYFDNTTSGFIIQRFFKDPESLQSNVLQNSKDMLIRTFSSIGLVTALVYTSWKLSIIAVSVMLLILYPSTHIRKIIKKLAHETTDAVGDILSYYTDTTAGIKVIYGYNIAITRTKQFKRLQQALFHKSIKSIKTQGWLTPSMHIIASVGIALILWQGSLLVIQGELTTGAFVSFIVAMLMLYNPLKNLGSSIMNAQISLMAAARIFELLDYQPSIVDAEDAISINGLHQHLEFENVSFEYRSETPVLENINLKIKKGETIALIGPSGGGKSTIANLIPRFYDVIKGAIRIDGTDIRNVTLNSLRQQISIVTQENFLFNESIADNLRVGKPDATEKEMWDALEKAYLADYIRDSFTQLETRTGERGCQLSGGQRQRLAIARAFLKDAPIVILDEATSALDNESEAIVQKAMDALMEDRTVIVIAHRLSTIRNADRIVVIKDGKIVEEGTHHSLLAFNGVFSMLYNTQLLISEEPPALTPA